MYCSHMLIHTRTSSHLCNFILCFYLLQPHTHKQRNTHTQILTQAFVQLQQTWPIACINWVVQKAQPQRQKSNAKKKTQLKKAKYKEKKNTCKCVSTKYIHTYILRYFFYWSHSTENSLYFVLFYFIWLVFCVCVCFLWIVKFRWELFILVLHTCDHEKIATSCKHTATIL